jgi:hypothetical protein
MRDKRFVAEHRGGPLKKEQHKQLIKWACDCAEHVLPLFGETPDARLVNALLIAMEWEKGNATVGDARKAAFGSIAVANESSNPVSVSVARAIGHAVSTAHMADHSLGGALYALKAVKIAGNSVEAEREWQIKQLAPEILDLVLSSFSVKEKYFVH